MTDMEYFKRKNELVLKYTGTVLIPDDQIIDIGKPQKPLDLYSSYYDGSLGSDICPYCSSFIENNCVGCPMELAGNRCDTSFLLNDEKNYKPKHRVSTWEKASKAWNSLENDKRKASRIELYELVEQYNKELENLVSKETT